MAERTGPTQRAPKITRRERVRTIEDWELLRQKEVQAGLALLEERREAERRQRMRDRITKLWPLWLGLLLGVLGPAIHLSLESVGAWSVILVYPFVVLAGRPELQAGPITHALPAIMLYAQFPIEGLLACIILKHHVRPWGVVGQVFLFHFLGLLELVMLSGVARLIFPR